MPRRFARALLRRCPRCGTAGIFTGWWSLAASCPGCGLRYEREEGYWLGAIAINTGATIVAFAAVLVGSMVATWPTPPWGGIAVATIAVNLLFPVAFYPISKTVWVAIDLGLSGE